MRGLSLLVMAWCAMAFGQGPALPIPVFQLGSVYPDPAGIVFPSANTAATVNPAVLSRYPKNTSFQLALSPGIYRGEPHRYFTSLTQGWKGFGLSVGAYGNSVGAALSRGGFVGMGWQMGNLGLGATLRDNQVGDAVGPGFDFGGTLDAGYGFHFAFTFNRLEQGARVQLATGYTTGRNFSIEAGLLLPPFQNTDPSRASAYSLGGTLAFWGMEFLTRSTYYSGIQTVVHTLGWGVDLARWWNVGVQFQTSRRWTLGFTFRAVPSRKSTVPPSSVSIR